MRRLNIVQFEKVQRAIELADKGYITEAAKLCNVNNVPIEVAHRVITKPKLRRNKILYLKSRPNIIWSAVKNIFKKG